MYSRYTIRPNLLHHHSLPIPIWRGITRCSLYFSLSLTLLGQKPCPCVVKIGGRGGSRTHVLNTFPTSFYKLIIEYNIIDTIPTIISLVLYIIVLLYLLNNNPAVNVIIYSENLYYNDRSLSCCELKTLDLRGTRNLLVHLREEALYSATLVSIYVFDSFVRSNNLACF